MEMMMYGLAGGYMLFLEGVLVACMFWAALSKPDRINSLGEFRVAALLLSLGLLLPVISMIFSWPSSGSSYSGGSSETAIYFYAAQWLAVALSVALALDSVVPRRHE